MITISIGSDSIVVYCDRIMIIRDIIGPPRFLDIYIYNIIYIHTHMHMHIHIHITYILYHSPFDWSL
jgi:hypothetical protein